MLAVCQMYHIYMFGILKIEHKLDSTNVIDHINPAFTVYNFYHLLVWLLPDTDKCTTFMYNIYSHGVRRRRGGGALSVHAFQWQLQVKIKTTLLSPTPLSISPFYTIDIKLILVVVSLIFLSIKFCWFIKNQFWRYTVLLPFLFFFILMYIWICGSVNSTIKRIH